MRPRRRNADDEEAGTEAEDARRTERREGPSERGRAGERRFRRVHISDAENASGSGAAASLSSVAGRIVRQFKGGRASERSGGLTDGSIERHEKSGRLRK